MCDLSDHDSLPHLDHDEYVLDTPFVREFVAGARTLIDGAASPVEACDALEPLFAELMANRDWLPDRYQQDAPASGMGGGIGSGCSSAPPIGRCASSVWSCRPDR